jgi:hypothetical protein
MTEKDIFYRAVGRVFLKNREQREWNCWNWKWECIGAAEVRRRATRERAINRDLVVDRD